MHNMASYTKAAMEPAMKAQGVILRAMAKKITWWQAAEIVGISDRHMRRWRERYEESGFRGCLTGGASLPQARTSSFPKNNILLWGTKILFQAGQATNVRPNWLSNRTPKIDCGNGFAHPPQEKEDVTCPKRDLFYVTTETR